MNKAQIFTIFLILGVFQAFATHNRAGEIVYRHISGLTYEITIYTFTYSLSLADRDTLDVQWGDGTISQVGRVSETDLPNDYVKSVYVGRHTYPGAGVYQIVMEDPNRNEGVLNIPNSVNTVFALTTTLQINPLIGINNTPVLYNDPIDKAAVNQVFIHNPAAFDPDGDSLSYKMDTCRFDGGNKIPGFSLPSASTSITVDEITGDLTWDTPVEIGIYNVAMEIEEWRNGVKISSIIRDIQIEVEDSDNLPPVVVSPSEICVIADSLIEFEVTATDPDNDLVTLKATGGAFELDVCPATFYAPTDGIGEVSGLFSWQTCCSNIRTQPYNAIFKATDDHPVLPLSDYSTTRISVVGPATQITDLEATNATVFVRWNKNRCENATGYKIYRKSAPDGYIHDECETGMPADWSYELIATNTGINDTTYVDSGDDGMGLTHGFYYCYRIVTVFNNGVDGYVSDIECVELAEGTPIMLKNSVSTTDTDEGAIHLAWRKPINLDTVEIPPPFKYTLHYSRDLYGSLYEGPIEVFGLNNTTYIDTSINTKDMPSIYKLTIQNYNAESDNWQPIGMASIASSPFLKLYSANQQLTLKVEENVPWENKGYTYYRLSEETNEFDSIGYSENNFFVDRGLINEKEYCYKVRSENFYTADSLPDPIINFSQIACGVPIDTIPPCCPTAEVESMCDDMYNQLTWTFENDTCWAGVHKYKIFYSNTLEGEMRLIETIEAPSIHSFQHYPELSLAACYTISAVDSAGNEAVCEQRVCIDNCSYYELPNVFTPNGDGQNDLFHPYPYEFVERVDMKIYNRWGNLVFETDDPDINWDGRTQQTNQLVPDGVYYYICDVYEHRLTGLEARNLSGFIHVYSEETITNP